MNGETDGSPACKLDGCLFFASTKLARILGKIADEAFSKTGLSPSHALLLYTVNHKGGMPQKALGEELCLTPSTITRLIEKLERQKLVLKKSEGKNVTLCTTPEGLALQEDIIKAWNRLHERYKDILTEEEAARFIELSGRLSDKLDIEENKPIKSTD